jgi:aspartyl-tRNA(Asn)/glutamyl-tRNA(Gln) amidotransferase subunit C
MHFDEAKLKKVAKLAKIKIDDKNVAGLMNDINQIIHILSDLQKIDTTGIEPLLNVTLGNAPLREDQATDSTKPEQIISNSNHAKYNCFSVPKVIE